MDGIIPERHVGNRHVVEPIGEFGILEWLGANVGVRVERLGDAGGERVNLDAGDGRMPVHRLRHQPDEMTDTARRFQNSSVLESELLQGAIHGAHHGRRGVVGVECGGAGRFQFFRGQQLFHLGARRPPFIIARVKDLRHGAPAHVTHERRLLLGCRGAALGLHLPQSLDGVDVLPEFLRGAALLRSCLSQKSGSCFRCELPAPTRRIGLAQSSGGSRMYFSRTISHA